MWPGSRSTPDMRSRIDSETILRWPDCYRMSHLGNFLLVSALSLSAICSNLLLRLSLSLPQPVRLACRLMRTPSQHLHMRDVFQSKQLTLTSLRNDALSIVLRCKQLLNAILSSDLHFN